MNFQSVLSERVLDVISVEVVHNGLRSIADECFIALMKSAYSTNIKERHDHSACIMDATGRLVVQAGMSQSIHLSSMLGHVKALLDKYRTRRSVTWRHIHFERSLRRRRNSPS